jgi:hypothetical protein
MTDTRESLEVRRAELEKRLGAIRKDLAGGLDADSEEQAVQLENLEVIQEIARLAENELEEVNRKLENLDGDE